MRALVHFYMPISPLTFDCGLLGGIWQKVLPHKIGRGTAIVGLLGEDLLKV